MFVAILACQSDVCGYFSCQSDARWALWLF